jgi:hypothetical protein
MAPPEYELTIFDSKKSPLLADCTHIFYDRVHRRVLHMNDNPTFPPGLRPNPEEFGAPAPRIKYFKMVLEKLVLTTPSHWMYTSKYPTKGYVGQTAPTPSIEDLPMKDEKVTSFPNHDIEPFEEDEYEEFLEPTKVPSQDSPHENPTSPITLTPSFVTGLKEDPPLPAAAEIAPQQGSVCPITIFTIPYLWFVPYRLRVNAKLSTSRKYPKHP